MQFGCGLSCKSLFQAFTLSSLAEYHELGTGKYGGVKLCEEGSGLSTGVRRVKCQRDMC